MDLIKKFTEKVAETNPKFKIVSLDDTCQWGKLDDGSVCSMKNVHNMLEKKALTNPAENTIQTATARTFVQNRAAEDGSTIKVRMFTDKAEKGLKLQFS